MNGHSPIRPPHRHSTNGTHLARQVADIGLQNGIVCSAESVIGTIGDHDDCTGRFARCGDLK